MHRKADYDAGTAGPSTGGDITGVTGEPTTYSVSAAFQARIACTILAMQPATLFIPTDVTVQNLSHE
jgi:hypothetical protein